jgi:hypothetical protein
MHTELEKILKTQTLQVPFYLQGSRYDNHDRALHLPSHSHDLTLWPSLDHPTRLWPDKALVTTAPHPFWCSSHSYTLVLTP